MHTPLYPSLYQINTRVWLTELSWALRRPATLDDIPDAELDRLAAMGFDWVWFLSVWQTGPAGQRVSRTNPEWRREFEETLPDLHEEDIAGSGFAITGYTVHESLGGDARARPSPRAAPHARAEAASRFRSESHRPGSPLGAGASRVLRPGYRRRTWRARPRTTRGSNGRTAIGCSPTGATRSSRAGRTRSSSTTAIRPLRRR